MISRIITWSLEHRLLVVAVALIVVAAGLWSLLRLPIEIGRASCWERV